MLIFILKIIQIFIGLSLIILITPQTPIPMENIVLRLFTETGIFTNYLEAKSVLKWLTWGLMFLFLLLTFVLNIVR